MTITKQFRKDNLKKKLQPFFNNNKSNSGPSKQQHQAEKYTKVEVEVAGQTYLDINELTLDLVAEYGSHSVAATNWELKLGRVVEQGDDTSIVLVVVSHAVPHLLKSLTNLFDPESNRIKYTQTRSLQLTFDTAGDALNVTPVTNTSFIRKLANGVNGDSSGVSCNSKCGSGEGRMKSAPAAVAGKEETRLIITQIVASYDPERMNQLAAAAKEVIEECFTLAKDKDQINNKIATLRDSYYNNGDGAMSDAAGSTATVAGKLVAAAKNQATCCSYTEHAALIDWLAADNFIPLGYYEYSAKSKGEPKIEAALGLCQHADFVKKDSEQMKKVFAHLGGTADNSNSSRGKGRSGAGSDKGDRQQPNLFEIRRTNSLSSLVRNETMDALYFRNLEKKDTVSVVVGFFKPNAYSCSNWDIPVVRRKMHEILTRSDDINDEQHAEEIDQMLQYHPRAELLSIPVDDLFQISRDLLALSIVPQVKILIYENKNNDSISVLVFIPKKRFSTSLRVKIEKLLIERFTARYCKRYVQISNAPLVRVLFNIGVNEKSDREQKAAGGDAVDLNCLKDEIHDIISLWEDSLLEALQKKYGSTQGLRRLEQYSQAFSQEYTMNFTGEQALEDVETAKSVLETSIIQYKFKPNDFSKNQEIELRVYSIDRPLELSSILPLIENLGLKTINIKSYSIALPDNEHPAVDDGRSNGDKLIHLQYLTVRLKREDPINLPDFNQTICHNLEVAMAAMHYGLLNNDHFHALIAYANLNWRETNVLRVMARYIRQTSVKIGSTTMASILFQNIEIARDLIELFKRKFAQQQQESAQVLDDLTQNILSKIKLIKDETAQNGLNACLDLLGAMCRTNYNKRDKAGHYPSYLSFKIESSKLSWLDLPRPMFETFVCSNQFEGVHLRFGKVARGGIRWSDRPNDFRYEVLGLVKAQVTKNSIIVPTGAKGGFVIKSNPLDTTKRNPMQDAISCYKQFVSGILDITDNVINGEVVKPSGVICYDPHDPYLVVAADKGTASFSDYANAISKEYNFFLGDAFASGGSIGYSHKAIGITARGAWVLLRQHLCNLGINIENQPITVVGIGDLSGDVFGNGLIESNRVKMVAAFNHQHIFLDPNPDLEKSYKERKRMFQLPRSQWSDYNAKFISKGGGIFERTAKFIEITPEVQAVLDIPESLLQGCGRKLSPNTLIQWILRSPVDLLWNGGIGTYVKAAAESHEQVNDRSNDDLRVNGGELRCRIVSEGGNLGFTQLGRIEYARLGGPEKSGGLINTDFVDNSAGVDCSDHEVNIKILLELLLRDQVIDEEQRRSILREIEPDVVNDVLLNNYLQGQIIDIEKHDSVGHVAQHAWLINHLEKGGMLNREVEKLPSNEELQNMEANGVGLSRPEISVLVSYAKNSIKKILSSSLAGSDLKENSFYRKILFGYFPKKLASNPAYSRYIKGHQLANEIIINIIANDFVNTLGCSFFHQLLEWEERDPGAIIASFILSKYGTKIYRCWNAVENLIGVAPALGRIAAFKQVQRVIAKNMYWLLNNKSAFFQDDKFSNLSDVVSIISLYSDLLIDYYSLGKFASIEQQISGEEAGDFSAVRRLLDPEVNKVFKAFPALSNIFAITHASNQAKCDMMDVVKIYFIVKQQLGVDEVVTGFEALINTGAGGDFDTQAVIEAMIQEIEQLVIALSLKELGSSHAKVVFENNRFNNFAANIKNHFKNDKISNFNTLLEKYRSFVGEYNNNGSNGGTVSRMKGRKVAVALHILSSIKRHLHKLLADF